ncbi:apoptosis-associated speck-like protein containing a CARD [Trachinotus anak]|uniref:apoptosis-associated speck-like protein containing a CARD n=1 Tax=Trachinotus anak TaxID=443729 RepID=UPI0039F25D36
MAPKTKKESIKDALAGLGEGKFREFVEQLLDRREEPWVARCDVEGQDHLRVTNVLVSAFTEARAPQVVAEILRKIRCNDEAERLDKETGGQSSQPGFRDRASAPVVRVPPNRQYTGPTVPEDSTSESEYDLR